MGSKHIWRQTPLTVFKVQLQELIEMYNNSPILKQNLLLKNLYATVNVYTCKERKNVLKMNKEVGMLLPKKELIQVEYIGKSINYYEDIYVYTFLQQHPLTTPIHSNHTHRFHPLATPTCC